MKDIFSELYKKVLSFFNNEAKEENSKETACNRLKLVLMQDRAKMEPALMEKMREEMIQVISRYVEIDKDALDLNIEAEGDSFALMLNIPVLRAKTREEVETQEGIVIKDEDDDDDDNIEEDNSDNDGTEEESQNAEVTDNSKSDEESENEVIDEDKNSYTENQEEEKTELKNENTDNTEPEKEVVLQKDETTQDIPIKDSSKEANPPSGKSTVSKKKIKHQKDDDL